MPRIHVSQCAASRNSRHTGQQKHPRSFRRLRAGSRVWWRCPVHFQRRNSECETPGQSSGVLVAGSSRRFGGIYSARWQQSKSCGCVGQLYEAKQKFLRHRPANPPGFQNGHAQSGSIIFQAQDDPMQLGHRGDEAEAKTVAAGGAASVETDEALQHARPLHLRNAGTAIGQRHQRRLAAAAYRQRDRGAAGRVGERVLDQVGEHLREQLRVAPDRHPGHRSRASNRRPWSSATAP